MTRVAAVLSWQDVLDLRTARVAAREAGEPVGIVEGTLLDLLHARGVDVDRLLGDGGS